MNSRPRSIQINPVEELRKVGFVRKSESTIKTSLGPFLLNKFNGRDEASLSTYSSNRPKKSFKTNSAKSLGQNCFFDLTANGIGALLMANKNTNNWD